MGRLGARAVVREVRAARAAPREAVQPLLGRSRASRGYLLAPRPLMRSMRVLAG